MVAEQPEEGEAIFQDGETGKEAGSGVGGPKGDGGGRMCERGAGERVAPDGHVGGQLFMAAALSGGAPRPPEGGPRPPGFPGGERSL